MFYSLSKIAAMHLPGLPVIKMGLWRLARREGWFSPATEGTLWRKRSGRGGGFEVTADLLPVRARVALMLREGTLQQDNEADACRAADYEAAWAEYNAASETRKKRAENAFETLGKIEDLVSRGWTLDEALEETGAAVSRRTVLIWRKIVRNIPRQHWAACLCSRKTGCDQVRTSCSEEAWEFYRTDYLRPEKPGHAACYRRVGAAAELNGWTIPSAKTFIRWIEELPRKTVILSREGRDKFKTLIPPQERSRQHLHALQAVNADGHRWDVFVRWPDGTIGRPLMVAWQDLYSNAILSWRVDRSETTDAIQLALGDLVEKYGIPEIAYLDNGRAFASKRMTGGTKTRFRFKIREGDAAGVMTILGIETRFVTPYSGQSKPIERAFRDLASDLAKHPAFAGAYVGNNPTAKPENYGSHAVPLEDFLKIISAGIEEHNNRAGRRTEVCGGKLSFRQAFEASYTTVPVRRPTGSQKHLWLRAAENITAHKQDGSIRFLGNRYWAEFLIELAGESLVIRFDPQNLFGGLHVYSRAGDFLGDAPVIEKTGFDCTAAAAERKRAEKLFYRATKMQLEAERKLTPSELAALLPDEREDDDNIIAKRVVAPFRPSPVIAGANALSAATEEDDEAEEAREAEMIRRTAQIRQFIRR